MTSSTDYGEDRDLAKVTISTEGDVPKYIQYIQDENQPEQGKEVMVGVNASGSKMGGRTLTVCWFRSIRAKTFDQKEVAWDHFCWIFEQRQVVASKDAGRVWSPASRNLGVGCGNDSVSEIHFAVIDADAGTNPDQIRQKLDGYAYLIHTSFSHTPEHPKFRIVMPLLVPVSVADWDLAWATVNNWLGGINDPATKDVGRRYWLPSQPKDAVGHFTESSNGKFLDVSTLPVPRDQPKGTGKSSSTGIAMVKRIKIDGIEETPDSSPAEGLGEMVTRCAFMQWASAHENQPSVSEPLWVAMISNACRFHDGENWIHQASCEHPKYDEGETDRKIARCSPWPAPILCDRIQALGFQGCPTGGCPLRSGTPTKAPAGLWTWVIKQRDKSAAAQTSTSAERPNLIMPSHLTLFITTLFSGDLIYLNEAFYSYGGGYFKRLPERVGVRHQAAKFLGLSATSGGIDELVKLSKDFLAVDDDAVAPNKGLICLANGTLDTAAYQLLPHSPEHRLTVKTDIQWNPDARCERWLEFIDEIFANDADKTQKAEFIQEWFGYCLVPDASQHKFVWMIGAGGNGKSVLLLILQKIVGEVNVSHAAIERLEDKRVRAELDGKLVNISAEMSADATISDGYLKSIVAGDPVEAERKYQPSFSFRPYVRLIGATNLLPRLLDTSDGFARRVMILTFNRQFKGDDCDPQLECKLLAELPGILVWAVEGLRRLRERGQFIIPQSSVEVLAQYRKESDPVAMFLEECVDTDDNGSITCTPLFESFQAWRTANGYAQMNIGTFGKKLAQLGCGRYDSGGRSRWRLKLKPTAPTYAMQGFCNQPVGSYSTAAESRYQV